VRVRNSFPAFALLAVALASNRLFGVPSAAADSPTTAAGHSAGPIRLDGRLDEPAWREAGPAAVLTQQSPRPGEPTVYRTEVRVLIIRDTIYFGFLCHDPEPDKIAVHTVQRDGFVLGDDTVSIVLDTYGDRRTGYLFQINAAGARIDGLISDPEHPSYDWDGIWDARTARLADAWSAEIEIPAKTLNFKKGLEGWGLNLERFVARERITLRWASPTLDSFLVDLSRAGTLTGLGDLRQGRGLDFSPYLIGKAIDDFAGGDRAWQGTGGLDFTWRITPQLAAVITENTDFAETEVDTRQVNLTRFPLFFPEKRAFFLEGSNQFEFGLGLGQAFIPFFTRRVGLLEGQQIPINGGLKVNGRVGRWNLGILDVQTRDTTLAPGTNLFAGRVSFDLTPKLRIGTIFTHGDPAGLQSNTLNGFDAVWRTSTFAGNKNLSLGGWTAFSAGDLPRGQRHGWGAALDFPNDRIDCYANFSEFGDALAPALGFLPRPGTRQYHGGCSYKPRPSDSGRFNWIRQYFLRNYYNRVDSLQGVNESWLLSTTPLEIELDSGERFAFTFEPQHELLATPFEIARGLFIPPGPYRFNRWRVDAETSHHRRWRFETYAGFGTFYSGHLTQWLNRVNWTSPKGMWQLGLEATNNFGRLREGNFVQRLWQLEFAHGWGPNIVLTSFVQYDTETQNLGANTRLRWTFKPGKDLFIVWNRGWERVLDTPNVSLRPDSEFIAVKLRWTFRQ
jgi:hypothetical protein